jgi:hypothetical protein
MESAIPLDSPKLGRPTVSILRDLNVILGIQTGESADSDCT